MKNLNSTAEELLEQALEAFQKTTGLTVAITRSLSPTQVAFQFQDQPSHEWVATIELNLTKIIVALKAVELKRSQQRNVMLVTRYVTPPLAEQLKELGIPFMDTAGNAYLHEEHLFIYVKGGKPLSSSPQKRLQSPFTEAGLRVIFALLNLPGLEQKSFRHLAQLSQVALGSVESVMQTLKQHGYLLDLGKRGRQLVNKRELLERWITAYPERLKPKLLINRYRASQPEWWQQAQLTAQSYWGGEIAATRLTQYLKPLIATVYIQQSIGEFLLNQRLKTDPHGDIELFKVFWTFEYQKPHYPPNLVPPVLIYADLLATGNARNQELARLIYEQELLELIHDH